MTDRKSLGQIAYEARERRLPFPLPAFADIPKAEQQAWAAVARAVLAASKKAAMSRVI
ncbi:hypothetical protein [Variovorax sp. 278MFTsu5.1]|jgi:hypothetical protein|uniref:hypothetical protein n=1 Tax=Variovorax sp. 278MFTsu5.1 TaxID=3158366 RepID=UPI003AAFCA8D